MKVSWLETEEMIKVKEQELEAKKQAEREARKVNWLALKDGEELLVQIPYPTLEDIPQFWVHDVEVTWKDPKTKLTKSTRLYVDCLGDDCPLCKEKYTEEVTEELAGYTKTYRVGDDKYPQILKFFLDLVDVTDPKNPKRVMFERGQNYKTSLQMLYRSNEDIDKKVFSLLRSREGNTITYTFINEPKKKAITDFPEAQNNAKYVEKTKEELEYYLEKGNFPLKS